MNKITQEYLNYLKQVESSLGFEFKNKELLLRCLIHDSFVYENEEVKHSNERLEFLGDAVLGLVISHLLFTHFPEWSEGELALYKSKLVSASSLSRKARKLNLGQFLLLGKGEEISGGRDRRSILSDALEAFIGAIYLDQGFDKVYGIIKKMFEDSLKVDTPIKDFKSVLQEYSQKEFKSLPTYNVLDEKGPPHNKMFTVRVEIGDGIVGVGEGGSKKEAEQEAARSVLDKLTLT